MKLLFIKIAFIVMVLSGLILVLSTMYMNTYQYKDSMNSIINFKANMPENLVIINLGNSQSEAALEYKTVNGYNMANGSQPFYYDAQILEQYSDRMEENCIVLMGISYFSFYYGAERQDVAAKYYWMLDRGRIRQYSFAKEMAVKHLPILFDIKAASQIFLDRLPQQPQKIDGNNFSVEALPTVGKNRAMYFQQWYKSGGGENLEEQKQILREMIVYCLDKGFRPILFTPPYTRYLNEHFPPDLLEEYFYEHIREVNIENIAYLDYSHDSRFEDNHDLFGDADHLNAAGRERFSGILFEDLRYLGLLK